MKSDCSSFLVHEFHIVHLRCHLLAKAFLYLETIASILSFCAKIAHNNVIWPIYF